jgi:hypothetical protein
MPTFALSVNRRCEVNKKYLGAARCCSDSDY